jgi:hypothetical protein
VIMHLHCCVAYLEMIIKVCSHSLFHWNIEPFSHSLCGTRRNKEIPAKWQQIKFLYNCISDKKGKNLIGIKFHQLKAKDRHHNGQRKRSPW